MKLSELLLSLIMLVIMCFSLRAQDPFDGYTLYNKQNQNITYLIDKDGNTAHYWSCADPCNYTVQLKDNGNLVRGTRYSNNLLSGAAIGGKIEEVDANCNIIWEFVYSSATYCSHHDFCLMPNGNVLLIAWGVKTVAELTQAGYNSPTSDKWPTHIVEVQQNGTGGQIVWEWHLWDHLIQDIDPSKDNYGVIANHPELMDINAIQSSGGPGGGGPGGGSGDWFHVNGIDYNATLDQIVFSSRNTNEIYIIDHSTTTAEAAGHSGGDAGKGGDFLYRWGNPSKYGAAASQTIPAAVHDPRWIPAGRPNAGYIQFFNNKGGGNTSSTVDAINPPLNGYNYTMTGNSFGPSNYDWRHNCLAYNSGQSASDRMTNGNTFVAVSSQYMYEVDSSGTVVWQYNDNPAKAFRYECNHPGISALLGANPCGLTTNFNTIQTNNNGRIFPNPTKGIIHLQAIEKNGSTIQIHDICGRLMVLQDYQKQINLSFLSSGVYYITIQKDSKVIFRDKLVISN